MFSLLHTNLFYSHRSIFSSLRKRLRHPSPTLLRSHRQGIQKPQSRRTVRNLSRPSRTNLYPIQDFQRWTRPILSPSIYGLTDVFDIAAASDIKGNTSDCATCATASPASYLATGITPAAYSPIIDFNINGTAQSFRTPQRRSA